LHSYTTIDNMSSDDSHILGVVSADVLLRRQLR
jgi:hypothetical protein